MTQQMQQRQIHDMYFGGVLVNLDNALAVYIKATGEYGVLVIHDTDGHEHEFDTEYLADEAVIRWRYGFPQPLSLSQIQQQQPPVVPMHTH